MEKSRVKLNIYGSDYIITSEDSESYVRMVGEKVDEKLRSILTKNPKISVSMAAVLLSLDFCDEVQKLQEKVQNLRNQLNDYELETACYKEKCEEAEEKILDLKRKINNLTADFDEYRIETERLKSKILPEETKFTNEIVTFSLLKNEIEESC